MAKPPKPVHGIAAPHTPPTPRSPSPGTLESNRLNFDSAFWRVPGDNQTPTIPSHGYTGSSSPPPSVRVSEMPDTRPKTVSTVLRSITWPADRLHMLNPLGSDSGLFTSPDGKLYAHVENEGHILVQRQGDGRYQVPFDFMPTLPGPFLNKSERQPTWTFERPDWLTNDSEADRPHTTADAPRPPEAPVFLNPWDAAQLSPAENTPDGIRHDKHRKTYVDTVDGTVMVRKNAADEYQQAFATTTYSPDIYFEQIPGTKIWRRKAPETDPVPERSQQDRRRLPTDTEEPIPGPSKPPHLDDAPHQTQTLTERLLSANPQAINLSYGLWRNWGKRIQPQLGQHIEIDELYYRIVQQTLNSDSRLAYLQHPLFSPALYDAFEYMLRDNPSLQPKWAIKRNDRWIVLDRRFPFEMPITQYISRTFRYLSDQSVSFLARAIFNQANRSEIITAHGLAVLNQTFSYWTDRSFLQPPRRELADPLLMLRDLFSEQGRGHGTSLAIPSVLGEGLQRLDLDPGRFPHHWNAYAKAPAISSLRLLFSHVLEDDGYVISSTFEPHSEDVLLFHRETIDAVFVLNLPDIIGGRLKRPIAPGLTLTSAMLQTRIGQQQHPLASYMDANKIVYLLGGVQTDALGQTTLFIIRER